MRTLHVYGRNLPAISRIRKPTWISILLDRSMIGSVSDIITIGSSGIRFQVVKIIEDKSRQKVRKETQWNIPEMTVGNGFTETGILVWTSDEITCSAEYAIPWIVQVEPMIIPTRLQVFTSLMRELIGASTD